MFFFGNFLYSPVMFVGFDIVLEVVFAKVSRIDYGLGGEEDCV